MKHPLKSMTLFSSLVFSGCGSNSDRDASSLAQEGSSEGQDLTSATSSTPEPATDASQDGESTSSSDSDDPPPSGEDRPCESPEVTHPSLLIMVDGLRPDYITPERMPHLYALGEQGVFGDAHAAAFPTNTRTNSPSVSTGSYPGRHGIIHNEMWVPEYSSEPFTTGSINALRGLDEATSGQMLTAPSLGELLEAEGLRLFVTGSGGTGTSYLQNHRETGKGIWTAGGLFLPLSTKDEAIEALGPPPADNPARTVWGFDAYLYQALGNDPPDAVTIWVNEPDSAGHANGVGHANTFAAVANVDQQIGRIVAAHEDHGLEVNIFVSTDHGFSTSTGGFNVNNILSAAGVSGGFRVVRNMVYMLEDDPAKMKAIVEALQRSPVVGNVYTRPGEPGQGSVAGTLSTEVIRWNHDRSADIIAAPAWTSNVNGHGFAGTTTTGGTATHGSDSPHDLQIRLVAAGPDIKQGIRSTVPTGNVDMAPTILHLHGVDPPSSMDGRVLCELLRSGPDPEDVHVHANTHKAAVNLSGGVTYRAELDTLQVGSTVYLREGRTKR